jgi:hypothetical protein
MGVVPVPSRTRRRLAWAVALATAALAVPVAISIAGHAPGSSRATGCSLGPGGTIHHVVSITFDNTRLRRDVPNVPSDLEQLPHLLDFIKDNGTLLANDHTVLVSHTAGGVLSTLTGLYPDRHGQGVSNVNVRFAGTGFRFQSSFGYWTDPVAPTTTVPNLVTPLGATVPAPWVPFTRAGCDVGSVAAADTVLENTGTGPNGDVTEVFGAGSPQWLEAKTSAAAPAGTAASVRAQTDLVGLAVHCAAGSPTCASGRPDVLPDEPGGYAGYQALFGAASVDPLLTGRAGTAPVTDLLGAPITDPFGHPGFPGDGLSAAQSLGYAAAMQEKGVPVTFAYIADAHDLHGEAPGGHRAFGPGASGYVAQLAAYDRAFASFFERLARDGINRSNTLFVFTVDEGDHFVGGTPLPAGCDGVSRPCDWSGRTGEIDANLRTLMTEQHPDISTAFTVHGDDAPTFYLSGDPGQNDAATRTFERAVSTLTAVNPYTGHTDTLMRAMADRAEERLLHLSTVGDPLRNPTFAFFADPDYFLTDSPATLCTTCVSPVSAWNHGDYQPEIATTWLGLAGPGVRRLGETSSVWTDHTDVRPTMLTLLGLRDSYESDGRAILEVLDPAAGPATLQAHHETLVRLGAAYKQLDAPFGALAMSSLAISTRAVTGGSATDDSAYRATQARLGGLADQRDRIAAAISRVLSDAQSGGRAVDEVQAQSLISQADSLVAQVEAAARQDASQR